MKPNIGISDNNLKSTASLLSTILADEMTLYIKTRKAHWNVTGESFMELHKLYEHQYKQLEESIDELAVFASNKVITVEGQTEHEITQLTKEYAELAEEPKVRAE